MILFVLPLLLVSDAFWMMPFGGRGGGGGGFGGGGSGGGGEGGSMPQHWNNKMRHWPWKMSGNCSTTNWPWAWSTFDCFDTTSSSSTFNLNYSKFNNKLNKFVYFNQFNFNLNYSKFNFNFNHSFNFNLNYSKFNNKLNKFVYFNQFNFNLNYSKFNFNLKPDYICPKLSFCRCSNPTTHRGTERICWRGTVILGVPFYRLTH
uniref:Uncharacterized protein n=1 Tax=Globodera rostochiensis TaxID=31243 RepID=A0A914IB62_GLORO